MQNGKYLLDTNTVIAFLRGEERIAKKLYLQEQVYISVIVVGELLYGAYCLKNANKNIQKIRKFISKCVLLGIDASTAEIYAKIKHTLKELGRPIPENDIWIAAQSIQNDLILSTRDTHFKLISNVKLEVW